MKKFSEIQEYSQEGIVAVGACVDEQDGNLYSAYSPAGSLLFLRMCQSLLNNGIQIKSFLSVRPVRSWSPSNGEKLYYRKTEGKMLGVHTIYLGFLNFGILKTLTHGVATLLQLAMIFRKTPRKNRVVVSMNNLAPHAVFLRMAQIILGVQTIGFIADIGSVHVCSWVRRIDHHLQIWHYRSCAALIALHPGMIKDFKIEVPCIIIPGGLDTKTLQRISEIRASAKANSDTDKNKISCRPKRFLYMGNVDHERGVLNLVDAFDSMLRGNDVEDVELVVVGPDNCGFEGYHQNKMGVRYLGKLPFTEALEQYRDADFLINPHPTDLKIAGYHFPSKVLEYMATGIPVVSTDYGGVARYFSDSVIIAKEGTVACLKKALISASRMTDSERNSMAERAKAKIVNEYNWNVMGEKIKVFLENQDLVRSHT